LGLVLVAAVAARQLTQHRYALFDDAHITFRHAANLAHGHGLVYNPGERVEGTSAFLFAVLLAIPIALGAHALSAAQAIGVGSTFVLLFYVFATVRLFASDRRGHLLGVGAALATALATPVAAYAMSGMETSLYVCLLIAASHHYLRFVHRGGAAHVFPILFALAAMTRPEGAATFGVVVAMELARALTRADERRAAVRAAAGQIAAFAAVFGPLVLFRLAYYGEVVPNTVLAKNTFQQRLLAAPLGEAVTLLGASDGPRIFYDFVELAFGPLALVAAAGLLLRRTRWATAVLAACSFVVVLVCLWNEGDWMPHYRLLVPLLPLAFTAMALGLGAFLEIDPRRAAGRIAPVVLGLGLLLLAGHRARYDRGPGKPAYDPGERHLLELGRMLATVGRDDDVMVTDIAGIIPYYANMRTVDMFGLCDQHIARFGTNGSKMGKVDYPYTFAVHPTFYVLNFTSVLRDIYRQPSFAPYADAYWAVRTPFDRDPKSPARDKKVVLVRKDRPGMDELVRAMQAELVDPRTVLGGPR
jgi:arabinofuranosyltransferase